MKKPAVYIVANKRNGVLYTGVTSSLIKRIYDHREGLIEGFTKKHGCKLLVFYELYESIESAIIREKQLKSGSRNRKIKLIEDINPGWIDLYDSIV